MIEVSGSGAHGDAGADTGAAAQSLPARCCAQPGRRWHSRPGGPGGGDASSTEPPMGVTFAFRDLTISPRKMLFYIKAVL